MSRTLSDLAYHQMTTEISDDPFLMLVRVFDGVDTVYLVNNTEEIISNGKTYQPFPVTTTLSDEDGEKTTTVTIEFDNVSLELISAMRATTRAIPCELDFVFASNPDNPEISFRDLEIRNITYNDQKISATLTADDLLNSRFPADSYTPSEFAGIFT